MFETFGIPAFFVGYQPLLGFHAMGRYTGVIVSVGDGVTYVLPNYESRMQFQAVRRFDFGGRDLTRYLKQLLHQQGFCFTTGAELEELREIKEKLCFISQGIEKTSSPVTSRVEKTYRFQDGSVMNLNHECLQCPEILFKPDGTFHSGKGISETVYEAVCECEYDTRSNIYCNVLLSGGSTFFPGFRERLTTELETLVAPATKCRVRVIASPQRLFSEWIGGSIEASLSTFQTCWILSKDYEEFGPDIVNRKCL